MHKDAQKVNFYGDGCNSDKANSENPNIVWTLSDGAKVTLRKGGSSGAYMLALAYQENDSSSAVLNSLIGSDGKFLDSKAPKSHASSSASEYGQGNANNYGHVKVSDNYISNDGDAASGIVASSKALNDAYSTLNKAKIGSVHGQMEAGYNVINIMFSSGNGCITLALTAGSFLLFISVLLSELTSSLSSDNVTYNLIYGGSKDDVISVQGITMDNDHKYRIKVKLANHLGACDVTAFVEHIENLRMSFVSET